MKNFGIVYMATSIYKEYFPNFLYSLPNLSPSDNKILFIISDGLDEYHNKQYQGIKIIVNHIIDLPYPIITACKLRYLTEFTKDYDLDYILYFDADSIIINKPDEFWELYKSRLDTGKLIMSKHPNYLYNPNIIWDKPFIIDGKLSAGYVDKDIVNKHKSYIITSFFSGTSKIMKEIDSKIYNMLGTDLALFRWMPQYPDEAYLNAINVNENILNNLGTIESDHYITINPYTFMKTDRNTDNIFENNFPEIETIFINQKYDTTIKNKKKMNRI